MKLLKAFVFLSCYFTLSSQNTFSQDWVKTFSGNFDAVAKKFLESYDEGYVISARKWYGVNERGWIIKTDINGNTLWQKTLGNGFYSMLLNGMDKTSDGGIIFTGGTDSIDRDWLDPFIIKLNACGNIDWCRIYNSENDYDYGKEIITLPDQSFMLLTYHWGYDQMHQSVHLLHLDPNGDKIWEQEYFLQDSLGSPLYAENLFRTNYGNFLITGYCYHVIEGQTQPEWLWPMMILADSTGESIFEIPWGYTLPFTEIVGGEGFQSVYCNSKFYTAMSYYHYPEFIHTPTLITTTPNGVPDNYFELVDGTVLGKASTIDLLGDSALLIGAYYDSGYLVNGTLVVLKADTLGNILKSKILDHQDYFPRDAIITGDNKYLIVSNNSQNNHNFFRIWKLNMDLEYDSVYTMPKVYDSLCPDSIHSSTLAFQCDITVGSGKRIEPINECQLLIFPNPSNDIVHITIPECFIKEVKTGRLAVKSKFHKWTKPMTLQLFDGYGRLVTTDKIQFEDKEILKDVSGWAEGIYYFRLLYEGGMVSNGKLIVTK